MMRGVSAMKEDVHNAIKNIDKGIFPQAFCKIIPDILGGDPEYCNIMHADGAGTKSSLAYMYWKETGDLSVWKGIAQDALIMNTDDLLCVGAVDNILVSSTIGRNKMLIPGEVISAIINGTDELLLSLGYEHERYTGKYRIVTPNDRRVALFAHQGFGLAFLSALLDIPYPMISTHFDMCHTGITAIEFRNGGEYSIPRVLTLSSEAHIFKEGLPLKYNNGLRY